jgi:hypothetical protein
MRYLTDKEVVAAFGDPAPYLLEDGSPSSAWPLTTLTYIDLPAPLSLSWDTSKRVTRMRCHKRIAPRLKLVLDTIHTVPVVWASIDDFGGCYAWRPIRGAKSLSRHCWGIAIDLDVRDNPMGSMGKTHQFVRDAFAAQGFMWGGLFTRPDPMHFEFADPEFLGT